jgi:hypothetical protein
MFAVCQLDHNSRSTDSPVCSGEGEPFAGQSSLNSRPLYTYDIVSGLWGLGGRRGWCCTALQHDTELFSFRTSIPLAPEFTTESFDQSIDEHAYHQTSGIYTAASPRRSCDDHSLFVQICPCGPFHRTSTHTGQSMNHDK